MIFNQLHQVIAFEGFEMTGKTTYMKKKIMEEIKNDKDAFMYLPDYQIIPDDIMKRGNRYLLGLGAVDMFRQMNDSSKVMLLDRWVASSYVYMKLYQQETDCKSIELLLDSARKCSAGLNPLFIHKCHSSEKEARVMYQISSKDCDHNDTYDRFVDFNDYYKKYLEFERLFDEFYKISGFSVVKVSSYLDKVIEVKGDNL